jgi:hypothetical protein
MTLTRGPTAPSSTAVRTSSAALRLLLAGAHHPRLPALRAEVPTRDGILGDTVDR